MSYEQGYMDALRIVSKGRMSEVYEAVKNLDNRHDDKRTTPHDVYLALVAEGLEPAYMPPPPERLESQAVEMREAFQIESDDE